MNYLGLKLGKFNKNCPSQLNQLIIGFQANGSSKFHYGFKKSSTLCLKISCPKAFTKTIESQKGSSVGIEF